MDEKLRMKFKAHQTFAIRKGWITKGLRGIQKVSNTLLMPSSSREAMDELGLGANQVVALRYWLEAAGLIVRTSRNPEHDITELGRLILKNDPYAEEVGTLWAIHCNIATSQVSAASWYFFFNEFKVSTFDKDDFSRAIERYIFTYNANPKVALSSLESDFSCILNTYVPHDKISGRKSSPENTIDCPLGELGLVDVENQASRTYRKIPANLGTLPNLLVLYAIHSAREHAKSLDSEIKLESLLDDPRMPGRMFNLDSVALLTKLYELENDKRIRINRTAGLDVVRLERPHMRKEDCLKEYYEQMR